MRNECCMSQCCVYLFAFYSLFVSASIFAGRHQRSEHVVQSHEAEYAQDLGSFKANTSVDGTAGAHLLVEKTPSCLRKFLAVVSHPLFMSIWTKASKWTRSSTRAAKAYLGKKFSVCLYPAVLEPGASPCTFWVRMLRYHRRYARNMACAGSGWSNLNSC